MGSAVPGLYASATWTRAYSEEDRLPRGDDIGDNAKEGVYESWESNASVGGKSGYDGMIVLCIDVGVECMRPGILGMLWRELENIGQVWEVVTNLVAGFDKSRSEEW
jgi:hypothetical protein